MTDEKVGLPLSSYDLTQAVALWLCDTFEDEDGIGCEPEAGPPCLGHFVEAVDRMNATFPLASPSPEVGR